MSTVKQIVKDSSVKPKYYTGGEYRAYQIARKGKRSFTMSKVARQYIAVPPAEGWPGGDPLKNGYKPTGGK